jgi:ubiquitin-protein ligase E3 C
VSKLVEQTQLLVALFSPRKQDDIQRLTSLSQWIYLAGYDSFLARDDVQPQVTRLAKVLLEALVA